MVLLSHNVVTVCQYSPKEIKTGPTYFYMCIYNVTISLPVTVLLIGAIVNDCVDTIMFVISIREEMGRERVEEEVVAVKKTTTKNRY